MVNRLDEAIDRITESESEDELTAAVGAANQCIDAMNRDELIDALVDHEAVIYADCATDLSYRDRYEEASVLYRNGRKGFNDFTSEELLAWARELIDEAAEDRREIWKDRGQAKQEATDGRTDRD